MKNFLNYKKYFEIVDINNLGYPTYKNFLILSFYFMF